jgi:glycosyltransferase involved in cell wall biosynthesis
LPPLVDFDENKWELVQPTETDESDLINLIYAGSHGFTKDQLGILIEALASIKKRSHCKFKLKVLGLTREEFIAIFFEEHNDLEKIEFVNFMGRRSHLESLQELARSDFQIILRNDTRHTRAGFPTKLVESLSCGIPVITNPTSNIEDYIINGQNGFLLNTATNESLIETLEAALSQTRESIDQMKIFCKKQKTFDFENYITVTKQFIENLCAKN